MLFLYTFNDNKNSHCDNNSSSNNNNSNNNNNNNNNNDNLIAGNSSGGRAAAWGCGKIRSAGMATYGTRNMEQQIRNTEHGTDNPEW